MRVLLSALGIRADVQPLIALGVALRGASHQVLCATLDFAEWVPSFGLEYRPIDVRIADRSTARMSPSSAVKELERMVSLTALPQPGQGQRSMSFGGEAP